MLLEAEPTRLHHSPQQQVLVHGDGHLDGIDGGGAWQRHARRRTLCPHRAAQGERIIVTDRGRPRATLGPLPGGGHIARGVAEGWITPPAEGGPPPPRPHRVRTTAMIAEVLADDRGE